MSRIRRAATACDGELDEFARVLSPTSVGGPMRQRSVVWADDADAQLASYKEVDGSETEMGQKSCSFYQSFGSALRKPKSVMLERGSSLDLDLPGIEHFGTRVMLDSAPEESFNEQLQCLSDDVMSMSTPNLKQLLTSESCPDSVSGRMKRSTSSSLSQLPAFASARRQWDAQQQQAAALDNVGINNVQQEKGAIVIKFKVGLELVLPFGVLPGRVSTLIPPV